MRVLAGAGADVILCARSVAAGQQVADGIAKAAASKAGGGTPALGKITVVPLDLADLKSVAAFALHPAVASLPAIHLLVLNAGAQLGGQTAAAATAAAAGRRCCRRCCRRLPLLLLPAARLVQLLPPPPPLPLLPLALFACLAPTLGPRPPCAGIMGLPTRQETKQGFEAQWGTNHVGHQYLAQLLLPKMQAQVGGRRRRRRWWEEGGGGGGLLQKLRCLRLQAEHGCRCSLACAVRWAATSHVDPVAVHMHTPAQWPSPPFTRRCPA